jgi:hypothetical protein
MAQVEYLIVAGGGGGGGFLSGGGGGAGGLLTATGLTVTEQNYTIVVGSGGTAAQDARGGNGGNSSFNGLTSIGGGGGGRDNASDGPGLSGGSGGGGSTNGRAGGSGTLGQGNNGGNGNPTSFGYGGGGGGAGSVGTAGASGGAGGSGSSSSINGSAVTYAAGGNGGQRVNPRTDGTPGTPNTGKGGGGGSSNDTSNRASGGIGGSGVVIIRYKTDGSNGVDATLTTGGTKTTSGIYTIHTFTTGGTFSVVTVTAQVEYLVVAGGGSGGGGSSVNGAGGGGGAGGYRCSVSGELSGGGAFAEAPLTVTTQNYTVVVGAGGTSVTGDVVGNNGQDSSFSTITSTGGGGGARYTGNGNTGGSGGGSSTIGQTASGTTGQGFAGGTQLVSNNGDVGASGGGAGAVGGNRTGNTNTLPNPGGAGVTSSITGTATPRAGGGGGGIYNPISPGAAGGSGGGGQGGFGTTNPTSGTTNTGGGGGGASKGVSGAGGSGIVIIRYKTDGSNGVDATLTTGGTKTTSGIYTIHTFTTGGTFSVVLITSGTTTSNVIKSATTVSIGTLKKNDFLIGVSTSVDYGPTITTGFWNGIIPPTNGYTVYAQKSSEGPSIRLASNDSELITIATQYGGTGMNTIYDALNYFNGNPTYMVTNINYPNIVTSGLTAMWDGGFVPSYPRTGTTWSDLSGNAYDLALVGPPVFSGTNGGGLYFDGVSDTAQSTSITLSYTQGYSLSMWFEISSISTNGGLFSFNGSNFINLTFTTSSFGWETGLAQKLVWNVAPVVGQIYNITCTYNPNTSTSIIYYNGAQVAINTSSTVQHTSQTAQLKLDYNPTFNLFNGVIYNCFFYTNKVLSPTEVTQNFDAQKARFGL